MYKYLTFIAVVLLLILATACNKEKRYERRILGEWEITRYHVDGVGDLTQNNSGFFTEILFEFTEYGDIEQIWRTDDLGTLEFNDFNGTYEIYDDELDMEFPTMSASNYYTDNLTGNREVYEIVELTKDKFVLDGIFKGKTVEIRATKIEP